MPTSRRATSSRTAERCATCTRLARRCGGSAPDRMAGSARDDLRIDCGRRTSTCRPNGRFAAEQSFSGAATRFTYRVELVQSSA